MPSPAATNTAHQVYVIQLPIYFDIVEHTDILFSVEVSSQVEVPVEATALLARPSKFSSPLISLSLPASTIQCYQIFRRLVLSLFVTIPTGTSGVPIKAAARRPAPVRKTRAARKSKPLKEFTIFEKLPFELRIMIMVLALPDPIIHEVRVHEKFEKFIYPENWPPARHGFPATNRHPALLRVNKEFRTFALKHYTPLLSRHPIVTGLGKKLYPSAGIDQLNYPDGTIVTEDMPETGNYCDLSGPLPNPFPTRGVLLKAHKRSYVDVERDTLYFNETTFKGNTTVRNLKGVRQINREVQVEDSCNVKHVAIDYAMWKGTPKYHYGWWKAPPGATILEPHLLLNEHGFTGRYIYPPHINEVDLNLGYLFEGGAFAALTTLTLVVSITFLASLFLRNSPPL